MYGGNVDITSRKNLEKNHGIQSALLTTSVSTLLKMILWNLTNAVIQAVAIFNCLNHKEGG
ncbi:hypothetical protein CBP51_00015 [Cellvibrio mixtus]|uniref:Uncharacterized protein n=1 Tax=Cellvibrio mixtus TaxID=39650 RepID=A0A266Q6G1_9GAMM|nr:hypothetical protein CBP51_18560 [Cellvibrio mixtus]OZY85474.1 hypothetical protein CBP51_00015 [Cellvibrio mixtus]